MLASSAGADRYSFKIYNQMKKVEKIFLNAWEPSHKRRQAHQLPNSRALMLRMLQGAGTLLDLR